MRILIHELSSVVMMVCAWAVATLIGSSSEALLAARLGQSTLPEGVVMTGDNLVPNGELKYGTTSAPSGWSPRSDGKLNATFSYPEREPSGAKATKVVVTNWSSGNAGWGFNHVAVSSHVIYKFSDLYNSDVTTNVTVEYLLSNGEYDYKWIGDAEATGGLWRSFSAQISVPRNAVSMTILHSVDTNGSLEVAHTSLSALPESEFAQGMVTFVLDDGLLTQFENARPILNKAGFKASYAVITKGVRDPGAGLMSWADIHKLGVEGNEISAHSQTHRDLRTLGYIAAMTEIEGSYQDLVAQGFSPKTFVYPYGASNSAIERLVQSAGFRGARTSYFGLDGSYSEKYRLFDIHLDRDTSVAKIREWIDQAITDKRWCILEIHDVVPTGEDEYSISKPKLQEVVDFVSKSGMRVVTLEEGLRLMDHRYSPPAAGILQSAGQTGEPSPDSRR